MAKGDIDTEPTVLAKIDSSENIPVYDHKEYGSAREAAEAGRLATDRQVP